MPKQWTDEHTKKAVQMWRDAWSLEDIGKRVDFATATVSAKLRQAGEDAVSYGSVSRAGLEAGSTPRRMGEVLSRATSPGAGALIKFEPRSDVERYLEALVNNGLATDRSEALSMLVDAGTRDDIVREAINLESQIDAMRGELKRKILEGEL